MMTLNDAKEVFINRAFIPTDDGSGRIHDPEKWREACYVISKWLEQEPCEMTVEEYRQRMIQAFHNADTDELIAICALPTEKEFEHLEWLLKNHYKKDPCEDAISRQAVIEYIEASDADLGHCSENEFVCQDIKEFQPVTPQPKIGHWIHHKEKLFECAEHWECSRCHRSTMTNPFSVNGNDYNAMYYCPKCGIRMEMESEKV